MINYFPLDNPRVNLYAEIGTAIKVLYPIGLSREVPEYREYPGIKKIMQVIEESMTRNKKFSKPWIEFLKKLRSGSAEKIHNTTMPIDISFSGDMILEKYEDNALRRIKRLAFSVSIVSPFFAIYGVDETFIKMMEYKEASGYPAINVITESPYLEFGDGFNYLKSAIEVQWPDYSFVPVQIGLMDVKGLQTPYSNLEECKVHNALFNTAFDYNHVHNFRGERYYGSGTGDTTVSLLPPSDSQ